MYVFLMQVWINDIIIFGNLTMPNEPTSDDDNEVDENNVDDEWWNGL